MPQSPRARPPTPPPARAGRPGYGRFDLWHDTAGADHLIVNAWLARQLPWLLAEAGLEAVGTRAFTPLERDPAGFAAQMAARRAAVALQAGAITEDEQRRWLAALDAERAAGRFLGGQTHLFVWGTRPQRR